MPPLSQAAAVGRAVAEAVALCGVEQRLARWASTAAEALACLEQEHWQPAYPMGLPQRLL
ncbi:MAG: hypothetical protein FJ060_10185 [Cyanobacteria bacterium K_Offshore_0m_m2_072]|nr:hypothetical protein [Cyanobacteria bacterium K_Offshore_0m_m2_072]